MHFIVVTGDATLRSCVDALANARLHVDIVAAPGLALAAVTDATRVMLLDEASGPPGEYVAIIRRIRREVPGMEAIVLGGPKSEDVLRNEHAAGVDLYIERPIDPGGFDARVRHRLDLARLKWSAGIVGRSAALEEIVESTLQVAPTEVPILIEGESGTGKDLIARAIHFASRRSGKAIESINCGSLAEGVLESELFGHEKGAFTGAIARRAGLFERADGGTVFLDEVGEMSQAMQVRLLRVLESGDVLRVGGTRALHVDVRLIAATNRDLGDAAASGQFRKDLYYRIKGVNLRIPPLRDRRDDIPILVPYFIRAANRRHSKSIRGIDAPALRRLQAYSWPGNVRELRNVVDTLVVLSTESRIRADLVDAQLRSNEPPAHSPCAPMLPVALNRSREEAEREMIYASILSLHRDVAEILELLRRPDGPGAGGVFREVRAEPVDPVPADLSLKQLERATVQEALRRAGGNRRAAADTLGISERTLYRKIKDFGLV